MQKKLKLVEKLYSLEIALVSCNMKHSYYNLLTSKIAVCKTITFFFLTNICWQGNTGLGHKHSEVPLKVRERYNWRVPVWGRMEILTILFLHHPP